MEELGLSGETSHLCKPLWGEPTYVGGSEAAVCISTPIINCSWLLLLVMGVSELCVLGQRRGIESGGGGGRGSAFWVPSHLVMEPQGLGLFYTWPKLLFKVSEPGAGPWLALLEGHATVYLRVVSSSLRWGVEII